MKGLGGESGIEDVMRSVLMMIADECEGPLGALPVPLTLVFKDEKQEAFYRDKIAPKLETLSRVKAALKKSTRSWELESSKMNDVNSTAILVALIILKSGGEAVKIEDNYHSAQITEMANREGGMSNEDIRKLADVSDLIKQDSKK